MVHILVPVKKKKQNSLCHCYYSWILSKFFFFSYWIKHKLNEFGSNPITPAIKSLFTLLQTQRCSQ